MTLDLNLIFQFCLIILMLALTVGVIIFITILLDLRQITGRIKKEVKAVTFLIDILDLVVSAFHMAKKKFANSKIGKSVRKSLRLVKEADDDA